MSRVDDTPPDRSAAERDQLQHDLVSTLTIISGRAQLLSRVVLRSSAMTDVERGAMLEGLAIIQEAVRAHAARIEALRRDSPDGHVREEDMATPEREDAPV